MLTLRKVNKELAPFGVELVKGDGYFYFEGEVVDNKSYTSVYVFRLNQLTLEQWLEEFQNILKS